MTKLHRLSQNSKWSVLYRKSEQVILGLIGLVCVVLLWQVTAHFEWINPLFISSPKLVLDAAIEQSTNGIIWAHFRITVVEFFLAFTIASIMGILIGMLMGWYRLVEYTLEPFIWLLYSSPFIAFYPLFIIWLGLGFATVVMIGFLLAFIPIIVNTIAGVKGTNSVLIRAGHSFGANNRQILLKIVLPSALPMIVSGLRIGVERALIGVIVGEMFASTKGLGYLISYYGSRLHTDRLLVSVVLVVLFGLVLTQFMRLVEDRLLKWQK
ncbi:MAG: ABC transporter permease [Clostridia bacterium]|jgi:NitT/TauT family transport system permease protein|nr:ABC transporter permease [Clostridia bacterium]